MIVIKAKLGTCVTSVVFGEWLNSMFVDLPCKPHQSSIYSKQDKHCFCLVKVVKVLTARPQARVEAVCVRVNQLRVNKIPTLSAADS